MENINSRVDTYGNTLEYKVAQLKKLSNLVLTIHGREVIIAPSNYASSQLCSDCGNKSSQTKDLSCRTYICQECGLEIDLDYNASLNLLKLAM